MAKTIRTRPRPNSSSTACRKTGTMPMRVVRITRNEVLFRPLQATVDDQPVEDVRKVLLTQEELEELRP